MLLIALTYYYKKSNHYFLLPSVHPLLYAVISLMVGIAVAYWGLTGYALGAMGISIFVAGFAIQHCNKIWPFMVVIVPLFFLIGWYRCNQQTLSLVAFNDQFCNKMLDVEGSVVEIERIQNPRFDFRILFNVVSITFNNCHAPYLSNHSLYIYSKSISDLQVCSTIVIHKIVIKKVENPSFALYLSKEKVAGTIFIEKLDFKTLSVPPSWHRYLANWKNNIYLTLQNKMSTKTFALFSSIFLGNRANVKKEMDYAKEPFKIWGTSHYLARSGLHLVIFVLVWQFLLSLIPIVFWIKQIILISLISTYSLFSWSSVSFERALLMFLIYKFCIISGKPSHYVHLIILVTGIVLILNPLQLFFLDFQLSFGLTFALAWFNHMQTHKKHISA